MPARSLAFILASALIVLTVAGSAEQARSAALPSRLHIERVRFVDAAKRPFEWHGITAFRLAERLSRGGEKEVIAYLDWVAAQKLTVVRVLTMARHLFELQPDEGIKVLPRLLELAAARGLRVEIVALADTVEIKVDFERHTKAVGAVAAAHANAIVEIANEPSHPTQDKRLHDPAFVQRLSELVPAHVPVALGSLEANDAYSSGRYVTWHSPRSIAQDGWGHVLELRNGAAIVARTKKPVVSDEPIGAAEQFVPGRRDNEPRRFAAAAALTRIGGLGATFHYEGGLQARIPVGRELACFSAWKQGLDLLEGLPGGGEFVAGPPKVAVVQEQGARAVVSRLFEREAWIVAVDAKPGWKPTWSPGWKQDKAASTGGVAVFRGRR